MAPQRGARGKNKRACVDGGGAGARPAESTQLVTSVDMMGCCQAAGFSFCVSSSPSRDQPRLSRSHPRPRHRRVMWPSSPPRTPPPFHGAPCHSYRPCVLACSIPPSLQPLCAVTQSPGIGAPRHLAASGGICTPRCISLRLQSDPSDMSDPVPAANSAQAVWGCGV